MASFSYSRMDRTSQESSASNPGPQASSARRSTWMRPGASNQRMQRVLSQVVNQGGGSAGSGAGPGLQRQPAPPPQQPQSPAPAPKQTTPPPLQTVKIPEHISASTTPDKMKVDRIIPRSQTSTHEKSVDVTLGGIADPDSPVIFSIAGQNNEAGSATIDGKDTVEVSTTGTVTLKLQGETQTQDAKHAGQLKLIATQRGKELAHSKGFSVSAIPQDMEFQFLRVIKGDYRGIRVLYNWQSDSDDKSQLDKAFISERVEHHGTGSFKNIDPDTSCYGPANARSEDKHAILAADAKAPGKDVASQTFMFKDDRTGALNIPMRKSGFEIVHEISMKDDKSGLQVTTNKKGASTSAKDPNKKCKSGPIASEAGAGSMTPQIQDV